jgi:hypothetical protein
VVWRWRRAAVACAALVASAALVQPRLASAARPLVTDDAFIVEHGACQVETWGQIGPAGDEFWLLPACNFFADLEITAGFAMLPSVPDSAPDKPAFGLQVKTVFLPVEERGYGIGLTLGTLVNGSLAAEEELLGTAYGHIPATVLLGDDLAEIDANLGFRYEAGDGEVRATWALAGEIALFGPLSAVAEVYGSSRENPFSQAGLRFTLVPEVLLFDTTYGIQIGGPSDERWMTVGLRFTPPPFF